MQEVGRSKRPGLTNQINNLQRCFNPAFIFGDLLEINSFQASAICYFPVALFLRFHLQAISTYEHKPVFQENLDSESQAW
jgi:hypothetical protein